MKQKDQDPLPAWLSAMKLKTGASTYPTSRHEHAEESMKRLGISFAVLPGYALSQTRKIGTDTNPSRPGTTYDNEYVQGLSLKIQNNVALPMMVKYRKTPNAPLDIAGGFNRTAAYALAGATHVDVYIIQYSEALKQQIEEVLPWMLNSDGMNPVSIDSIRDKAIQLVEAGVYDIREVTLLFPGLRQDTLKLRKAHREVLELLNKAKVQVPRHIVEGKTYLAEFNRIKLASVRVPAVILAVQAGFNTPDNRQFVNQINAIEDSQEAKLAFIQERRNELGLGENKTTGADKGANGDNGKKPTGPKTSCALLKFLKAATPYIRYTRSLKSFKDLGIKDPDEIADAKEQIKRIQVINNVLSV